MTSADDTADEATDLTDEPDAPGPTGGPLVPPADAAPLRYADLRAPQPAPAAPPNGARWLAFAGILLGGLLGGLIGWGVADLLAGGSVWPAVGGLLGAVSGAAGVGVIAGLTLRAMNEWRSVRHPEGG